MKVYLETYGCATNQGDAYAMRGILEKRGHEIVKEIKEADSLVLMTCTVIGTTEQRMLHRIRILNNENKQLIVSGCMASVQKDLIRKTAPSAKVLPPRYFHHINDLIEGKITIFTYQPKTSIPRYHHNIAILPISEGCLFSCTYCITKKARGILRSYPPNEIIDDVHKIVKKGCKEIRLTAQDTASYGRDIKSSLPFLIKEISKINGDFMVRIGMMNPVSAGEILTDLLTVYSSDKIFKFLHLPIQSGSDAILKNMGRRYTIKRYKEIIESFRELFPDITIATDIIVAFPGETERQFQESCQLLGTIKPDIVNITRFSARPGTIAKKMDERISTDVAKKRSQKITSLVKEISIKKNNDKIGKRYRVLAIEKRQEYTMGRTINYKPVLFRGGKIGEWVNIEIKKATQTHLIGKRY